MIAAPDSPVAVTRTGAAGHWARRDEAIMGTSIRVELWHGEAAVAECAADAVLAEMHRIDRSMSPYKADSQLSRVNAAAALRPVAVDAELFALLQRAQDFAAWSDGAFDITFAASGALYDYRRGVRPAAMALETAQAAVGYPYLQLDAAARTVRFTRPGMRIDLGGVAKGHAVDNAARLVAGYGIAHGSIAAGGDSRLIGDRRGRPWSVGVRHPCGGPEHMAAVLPLQDVSVSTSGDYERGFVDGAERVHHVLDPRTGRSPQHVRAVTVLANDGVTAEALSKIVFVLGPVAGLQRVEALGADALVFDGQGRMQCSSGLEQAA